jgi:hypothetical protein
MLIKSAMPILRDKNNNAKVHCPRKIPNVSVYDTCTILHVSADINEEGEGGLKKIFLIKKEKTFMRIAECECNWAMGICVSSQ